MSRSVAGSAARPHATRGHAAAGLYSANGARKYINAGERARVIAAARRLPASRALFVLTLLWTGARISEVLALTPADFQIAAGVVAIRTLKRRRHVVRELPIPPALMAALDRSFGLAGAQADPRLAARPVWRFSRSTGWRLIKSVMNEAGITGRPACPRGLRHGFGVGTLQAGVPITLVQRWLGHARLTTTAIYAEISGPEETAFAQRFWAAA